MAKTGFGSASSPILAKTTFTNQTPIVIRSSASTFPSSSLPSLVDLSSSAMDSVRQVLKECPENTEFAIALIREDQVLQYGLLRAEKAIRKVENSKAVFEIGSITKIFTTHLLMQEVRSGNLDLDKPIQTQSEVPFSVQTPIPLRQLASHTSGLPPHPSNMWKSLLYPKNPFNGYSRKHLRKYLVKKLALRTDPGSKYKYSNLGIAVLTRMLELHTKQSYSDLLSQRILAPLKMNATTLDRSKVKDRLVRGYNEEGRPTKYWDMEAFEGAGALLSNTEDLSKYSRFWMEALQDEFSEMIQKNASVNETIDVGLGWHLVNHASGAPFAWHNGGTGGFKSSMGVDPNLNIGVVILSNVGRGKMRKRVDELCYFLMSELRKGTYYSG